MRYSKPITELIKQRFSCRSYVEKPIEEEKRQLLESFLSPPQTGPFGTSARFKLVVATEEDRRALRGLGTYGYIKGATGFIIGAVGNSQKDLEDFGYLMERIVLFATDIDLGTCWLGGSFRKSSFAKRISASSGESVPAVSSVGYVSDTRYTADTAIRRSAGSRRRFSWEHMFFHSEFGAPISREDAGAYAVPLEMIRLGPSASNKQPWRTIKDGDTWHFYLQRTRGYREAWTIKLLRVADIQRLDMGIAMSHFELTANELGLRGRWEVNEPEIERPDELTEYTASWIGQGVKPS
ncbi:MAG: nitroreductase [Chloroflexi bacterium]|nr:nitroreductase [Chloroflexota bacterium]